MPREKLERPVIKSDVGYFIEALNGFPGPFLRYINDYLTSEEILKLMEDKENRTILLKECLNICNSKWRMYSICKVLKKPVFLKFLWVVVLLLIE